MIPIMVIIVAINTDYLRFVITVGDEVRDTGQAELVSFRYKYPDDIPPEEYRERRSEIHCEE